MFEKHLPHTLDVNTNQVVVDQYFRIRQGTLVVYNNENKLFAIGDMIHTDEPKASNLAIQHAKIVSKVIRAMEAGEKLPKYEATSSPVRFELGSVILCIKISFLSVPNMVMGHVSLAHKVTDLYLEMTIKHIIQVVGMCSSA
ncbi:hypothetical protein AKO1_008513 [Acrasis kona]|uniref:Uncharacterized protein n=1 Tax=Acrasis kona TaxID=1008807 RepID=A0AAW2YLR8_9EUKA